MDQDPFGGAVSWPDQARMALISGPMPTMFITRVIVGEHGERHLGLHVLRALYQEVRQRGRERLAKALPEGLTPRQLVALHTVDASPGTSRFGIVRATGMDRSTTSMVMKRLIARKLVKRRREQMVARTYVLQLTNDGRAALTYGLAALKQVETLLLQELAGKDQTHLVAALQ